MENGLKNERLSSGRQVWLSGCQLCAKLQNKLPHVRNLWRLSSSFDWVILNESFDDINTVLKMWRKPLHTTQPYLKSGWEWCQKHKMAASMFQMVQLPFSMVSYQIHTRQIFEHWNIEHLSFFHESSSSLSWAILSCQPSNWVHVHFNAALRCVSERWIMVQYVT